MPEESSPQTQEPASRGITFTTRSTACWACEYSSCEEKRKCRVCKRKSAQNPLSVALPVKLPMRGIKPHVLDSIYDLFPNDEDAQEHILGSAKQMKKKAPARSKAGDAAAQTSTFGSAPCKRRFTELCERPVVELVRGNREKKTPSIMVTAANNSNPTMDIRTWKALERPVCKGSPLEVCVQKRYYKTKTHSEICRCKKCKHSQECTCNLCQKVSGVNQQAKLKFAPAIGDETQEEDWVPREADRLYKEPRVWWRGPFPEDRTTDRDEFERTITEPRTDSAMNGIELSRRHSSPHDGREDVRISGRRLFRVDDSRTTLAYLGLQGPIVTLEALAGTEARCG